MKGWHRRIVNDLPEKNASRRERRDDTKGESVSVTSTENIEEPSFCSLRLPNPRAQ
jgi:hypothetical protein